MAGRRESAWVPVLTALVVVAGNAAAIAINAATSVETRWPWGLEIVRVHPFRWSVGFSTVAVAAGATVWLLQQRTVSARAGRWLPPGVERPVWAVDRPAEVDQLVAAVLRRPAGTTVLHGAGGFGKTTLTTMVRGDRRVRRRFGDRIYPFTIGRDAQSKAAIAAKVNDLIKWVTNEDATFTDPELAGRALGSLLDSGPRSLLVIDDVWSADQVAPFLAGGRQCARLVTTRKPTLLRGRSEPIEIGQMSSEQARTMLTRGLPLMQPAVVKGLLAATGRWPLLLGLVNKILANSAKTEPDVSGTAAELCARLLAAGPAVVDEVTGEAYAELNVDLPRERVRAVRATMEASISLLDEPARARFRELAVFFEDAVPVEVVAKLWHATDGLGMLETRQLCARLDELALVSTSTRDGGAVTMHDVVRDFLQRELGAVQLKDLHGVLLDAVAADLPAADPPNPSDTRSRAAWWKLGGEAGYTWRHLVEHLLRAGRAADAEAVAGDLRWVGARLERFGVTAAYTDLALIDTPLARRLRVTLARSAHLLAPTQPAYAVVDVLHSRIAGDPDWEPQVVALRDQFDRPRLVNRRSPPDLPHYGLQRVLTGHTGWVTSTAIAPDGKWLASASTDGTLRIWDPNIGLVLAITTGRTGQVNGVAIAPDGTWLATANGDGTIRIWDAASGQLGATFAGDAGPVNAVAIALDGTWLVSASRDQTVRIWDAAGRTLATFGGHTRSVIAVAIAPDGTWLATASADRTVRIWDAATRQPRAVLDHDGPVNAVAIAPDGTWLATADDAGVVRTWDAAGGQLRATFTGHSGSVNSVAIGSDGTWLATAGDDYTARIWDIDNTAESRAVLDHDGPVAAVAVAPDDTWLATTSEDGAVRIWDATAGPICGAPLAGYTGPVTALAIAPDATWLATTDGSPTVWIWDATTGQRRATLDHDNPVHAIAIAPDSTWLATTSSRAVWIWDATTGQRRFNLDHDSRVHAIAIAADSTWLAAVSGWRTAWIWDPAIAQARAAFEVGSRPGSAMAIASDGTWLAIAGDDGKVRIWDATTHRSRITLTGHTASVRSLAIASDDTWLATASNDGTMRIWDASTGHAHAPDADNTASITSLAIASHDTWLATTSNDGTVQIWDTATWQPLALIRLDGKADTCAWLPNTDALVVGGPAGLYMFDFLTNPRPERAA